MVVYQISPPKKRNFLSSLNLTFVLILTNVAFFILFYILFIIFRENPASLYDFVAIKPSSILEGKYLWTFLTSMFMHGGFFHLFVNMLSLLFVGSLVEKILGKKRYIYFYLASGIFANFFFVLASLIFPSDFNTYAVGASGALFGLVGLLVLLTPNLPVYIMFIPIPIKIKYAAPGLLAVLWLISIAGDIPIGNTAHFGGLVAGVFYGLYLKSKYKNKTKYLSKYFS